jgi:hypothetical protein
VSLGIPVLAHARCTFDKEKGTVRISRRSLLQVQEEEIPLSFIIGLYVRRGKKKFTARYTAILKLRRRDRLEFKSISGAQAKRAMRTVREFLY